MILSTDLLLALTQADRDQITFLCALCPTPRLTVVINEAVSPACNGIIDLTAWTIAQRAEALTALVKLEKVARGRTKRLLVAMLEELAEEAAQTLIIFAPDKPAAWAEN